MVYRNLKLAAVFLIIGSATIQAYSPGEKFIMGAGCILCCAYYDVTWKYKKVVGLGLASYAVLNYVYNCGFKSGYKKGVIEERNRKPIYLPQDRLMNPVLLFNHLRLKLCR